MENHPNDIYLQHVSMYHRNKVHTDEFWRYELTKNRRTIMDDKANEDLWKKQLGKHAEETARQKLEAENAAAALAALAGAAPSNQVDTDKVFKHVDKSGEELKWMENMSKEAGPSGNLDNVSTEMKLMALQSLQNSLRFMSMANIANIKTEPASASPAPTPVDPSPHQESYLNLLAQLTKRESEDRKNTDKSNQIVDNNAGDESRKEMSSNDNTVNETNFPVLPTNEESSVKRTQMWLQQVTKYRNRVPKPELEANHDDLWEQQISRVKKNPVRSPLEPEEIVIEDEVEAPAPIMSPAPIGRISTENNLNNNNNNNNNSNNNNNVNVNNNNNEGVTIFPARIIFAHPVAQGSTATLTLSPAQFVTAPDPAGSPLKVFLHQPIVDLSGGQLVYQDANLVSRQSTDSSRPASVSTPVSRTVTPVSRVNTPVSRVNTPARVSRDSHHTSQNDEDGSMLKSLLMDRMKRKRSSSTDDSDPNLKKSGNNKPGEQSNSSKPIQIPSPPNDILRKRLLGWDDPQPQASPTPKTDEAIKNNIENKNNFTGSQSGHALFQLDLEDENESHNKMDKNEDNSDDGDIEKPKYAKKGNIVTYANTSVLKHLLHRYTETKQP